MPDEDFYQKVQQVCLTAGKLMIEGGSEMYRVEDTMLRIARNAGVKDPRVFTTPTGIFIAIDNGHITQLEQVKDRNINLELVDRVNNLSREFADKRIDLSELEKRLKHVAVATPSYPLWLQIFGAAVLSATLMVLFTGQYDWPDFPASAFVGAVGFWMYILLKKYTKIRFLSELLAAIWMGTIAYFLWLFMPVLNINNILIGALMTLVPGLALTNALRDLFTGDLLSGIMRGVEALLTALALGGGVGIVIKFFGA